MTDVKLLVLHCNTWNHLTVCKQMINGKSNKKWTQVVKNGINIMLQIIYI